jgi:alpha-D-ribose 1-methylphosphonate 5-triphosphate synthase subunit PhnG
MGDDGSKAEAAAVLDAAHTGGFGEFALVEPELARLEDERQRELAQEAAAARSTQVRFHVLEDREL